MGCSRAIFCLAFLTFEALLLSFSASTTVTTSNSNNAQPPNKLVMKLVHRDSFMSHFYNSTESISERAERDLRDAIARSMFLQSRASHDIQANLFPGRNLFSVHFYVGQPPIPQIAVLDTGSPLLWIQCKPCQNCFQQAFPLFDSSESSTYKVLNCHDALCSGPYQGCKLGNCSYELSYLDGSSSRGDLALEQLSFQTSDDGITVVSNVLIGCGRDNSEILPGLWAGIFGLAIDSSESLIGKFDNRFSYCIGSITDEHYNHNRLVLGDAVNIQGSPTPIVNLTQLYYVDLEGISVGDKKLDIDPKAFKQTPLGTGGVILDSGSPLTIIPANEYNVLRQAVHGVVGERLSSWFIEDLQPRLCYEGNVGELNEFTGVTMTFHFAGGADLVLDQYSMFYQGHPEFFCMSVIPKTYDSGCSTIGILAQQNYNVGFDLKESNVYLQRIDCQLLDA